MADYHVASKKLAEKCFGRNDNRLLDLEAIRWLVGLVQFVEDGNGRFGAQTVELQRFRQRSGAAQKAATIIGIIPVEIDVAERSTHCGLADLSRAGDQSDCPSWESNEFRHSLT
jgi:hypothetical protein